MFQPFFILMRPSSGQTWYTKEQSHSYRLRVVTNRVECWNEISFCLRNNV